AERRHFIRAAGIHELADGSSSAHYEFAHSLYREVLYGRLSAVQRLRLHRKIGERLEALSLPPRFELASELAQHFEQARDYDRAIRFLIRAAENAARRFAHGEALEALGHALELVPLADASGRVELELRILERTGDAHYLLGAMAEAAAAYEAGAARAEQARHT